MFILYESEKLAIHKIKQTQIESILFKYQYHF